MAPKSSTKPSKCESEITESKTPKKIADAKALEPETLAASRFFSPSLRDIMEPQPIPKVKPTAWIIAISEKTIPTAALALVPNCDTK